MESKREREIERGLGTGKCLSETLIGIELQQKLRESSNGLRKRGKRFRKRE